MKSGMRLLQVALWVFLVDALAFGVLVFFLPEFTVETLGDAPQFDYWWVRWAGGLLLAFALGAALVIRKPSGQEAMVTTFAAATFLAGVGVVWSWLAGEYDGTAWFLAVTLAATLAVSGLLWWTRYAARGILTGGGATTPYQSGA